MKALRNILVFLSISFFPQIVFSQVQFEKIYGSIGSDFGYSVAQMFDTGYAVVGSTTSFGAGNADVYLLKTDLMGVAVGHKTFGGINVDRAFSIKSTSDSGLVIAGYTNSFGHGGYDMYIIRTDKNCDTIWTKTIGGADWDFAYSVTPTSDGGFIIGGATYSFGQGNQDMYLVKLNSLGDTLWTKTYGGVNDDEIKSVKQTLDGGYILTGYSKSLGDIAGDIYTVKTNSIGDILWTFEFDGGFSDFSYDIIEDNTGAGYIIGGETTIPTSNMQGVVVRINTSGILINAALYGGTAQDGIYAIAQSTDGRFVTMGYTYSYGAGMSDFVLYKENPIGTYVGSTTFGGAKVDNGYCVNNTMDGGFIICGTALSYSTFEHIYLIKTDSAGVASGTVINVATDIASQSGEIAHFSIYPNPCDAYFYIQLDSKIESDYNVSVVDVLGRIVFSQSFDMPTSFNPIEIDSRSFKNGIYFVRIESENYVSNQKLVVKKN